MGRTTDMTLGEGDSSLPARTKIKRIAKRVEEFLGGNNAERSTRTIIADRRKRQKAT